jgi:hypothetical protein
MSVLNEQEIQKIFCDACAFYQTNRKCKEACFDWEQVNRTLEAQHKRDQDEKQEMWDYIKIKIEDLHDNEEPSYTIINRFGLK